MFHQKRIAVLIPALNEEQSIGKVLEEIPDYVDRIIVCDNGSTDSTPRIVTSHGAELADEPDRGYGAACLKAMSLLDDQTEIVAFMDADYSDFPRELDRLLLPIIENSFDMVIGSRMLQPESRQYLTPVARFGNRLATGLIRLFWKHRFTDLGPFRAIRYQSLCQLNMQDRNFGWTVEMQIKAARQSLRTCEVAVSYRPRLGQSKISGTLTGSIKAGTKILYLIFRELVRP